ncbi:MAG: secondary thiamine-phosphate synthase enzyme YjbQ [Pseudomonadota bacterium]|nr:MAG: secondary thiamine-phosphate synthase [Pseudomonadota bacterium]
MHQEEFRVRTAGRQFLDLTSRIAEVVRHSGVRQGLCNVFLSHTSASLVICENADPAVRRDLERFMQRIARDGDPAYEHDTEGPDDMPAHIRTVLTQSSLVIPVRDSRLALGTWQGVYLWEHRTSAHERRVLVTVW